MTRLNVNKLTQFLYPIGYMISSGVSFVITIWLTNYFTTEDFGNYSIFKSAIFTLWPFIGLSTHFYIQSRFHRDNAKQFKSRLFSSILLNFVLFLVLELICLLFHSQFSEFLGVDRKWVFFIPVVSLAMCVLRISLVIMQLGENPGRFIAIALVQVIFNIGLLYYLVIISSYNWEGQAFAYLFGSGGAALLCLLILYEKGYLKFMPDLSFLKDAFKFGVSAIMVDICIVSIAFADKIFIKKLISTESLGVYAVALQLAAVISVIDSAFTQAIYPRLYKYYASNSHLRIRRESFIYVGGLSVFCVFYGIVAPYIYTHFIGKEFTESIYIMRLLIIALVVLSIYKILVSKLYYFKRMSELVYPSFIIIIINTCSHIYLVPSYGIVGAIYTNIISYALLAFAVLYITQKPSSIIIK